jgi:hypothetical protein
MNQKTIRKKRQNCKKKLSTKKTRKSHRKWQFRKSAAPIVRI